MRSPRGSGSLRLREAGGSGPHAGPLPNEAPEIFRRTIPARADNAVNVPITVPRRVTVLGAPKLTLTYRGQSPKRKVRVLAQLVDEQTGTVVGNQITPVRMRLDGRRHTVKVRLEPVAATYRHGGELTLQVAAQSSAANTHPRGGHVHLSQVILALPSVGKE